MDYPHVPLPCQPEVRASTPRSRGPAPGDLTIGLSGARRNAAVAACTGGVLHAFCEQERVTRVKGARLDPGRLPEEALSAVLTMAGGRAVSDVRSYVVAEEAVRLPGGLPIVRIEHHLAHAASAFYTSPFLRSAVLVCDHHSSPELSVWVGEGAELKRHAWNIRTGLASLYSAGSAIFGFPPGQEHELEALARLDAGIESPRLEGTIGYANQSVWTSPRWRDVIADWLAQGNGCNIVSHRARVASALQQHLGRLLLQLTADIQAGTGMRHLCLAGGLFYNTFFNSLIRRSAIFDDVFVAPNPGNAGLAAGAALLAGQCGRDGSSATLSPFLGPQYSPEEIKATLDNCKLSYEYLSEGDLIVATVDALRNGRLVGWFQGRMEWGHRALGNRSILASPLSPYVLDNLNVYLKKRERHRTYGLSVTERDAGRWFDGPPGSRFMEYEYTMRDPDRLRNLLPQGATTLRVQTVPDSGESRRFARLHEAFGEATGLPALVNTSFNGFSEPIVCSPRDAIRVFFGSGLDVLVMGRFLVRK